MDKSVSISQLQAQLRNLRRLNNLYRQALIAERTDRLTAEEIAGMVVQDQLPHESRI